MKKLFLICSTIITIGLFLPFIGNYSLYQAYNQFVSIFPFIKTSKVDGFIIVFLLSSWFVSFGYSKKVKISIIGLIGSIIYLYYYYRFFSFSGYSLIGNIDVINVILGIVNSGGKYFQANLGIGFYLIFWGFLINSFSIINIVRNFILISNNKGIPYEGKDNQIIHEQTSITVQNINKKIKPLTIITLIGYFCSLPVLFFLSYVARLENSLFSLIWDILIIISFLSCIFYLDIIFNFTDKIKFKHRFFLSFKKIDKYFFLLLSSILIVLFGNIFLPIFCISVGKFEKYFLLCIAINFSFIIYYILGIVSYHKLNKVNGIILELEKFNHIDLINKLVIFLKNKFMLEK